MISSDFKNNQPLSRLVRGSSYLTDIFRNTGGRLIDSLVFSLGGNRLISSLMHKGVSHRMKSVSKLESILVVSDLNIGDAVNIQAVAKSIRNFLPHSRIDYLITKSAANLIEGNRDITNVFPLFTGKPFPNISDFELLRGVIKENNYDLVINLCPLFTRKKEFGDVNVIHACNAIAPEILRKETSATEVNHIIYQLYIFIRELLSERFIPETNQPFRGVSVNISEIVFKTSARFFSGLKFKFPGSPVILFNPDASSPYTTLPVKYQSDILAGLLKKKYNILLACGYASTGIEKLILSAIEKSEKDGVILLPYSMSLEEMAAIVDFCDLYFGADTGPLHIAAARKNSVSEDLHFRNRTSVFSVFGSTPGRIYGYDSERPGYFGANQDAPSRVYNTPGPCHNITCLDKKNKVCKVVHCFDNLDTDEVISGIEAALVKRG
jgi:ADP-heptose:LPS heptosyltransferase